MASKENPLLDSRSAVCWRLVLKVPNSYSRCGDCGSMTTLLCTGEWSHNPGNVVFFFLSSSLFCLECWFVSKSRPLFALSYMTLRSIDCCVSVGDSRPDLMMSSLMDPYQPRSHHSTVAVHFSIQLFLPLLFQGRLVLDAACVDEYCHIYREYI